MRHVSRTHRVALDWLFDRIYLDPKIQIKYIDTKNELADILTKGNFTRDEWNHLLTLFNISHFSSTACIAAMAKRAQQESGEGRVTAKSRPMMNLTARTPSFVSSSASSNPGRTSHGYQDPERPVLDDRTEQPVEMSRKERKKIQVKKESQKNRNQWWIWSRDAPVVLPSVASESPGKTRHESLSPLSLRTEKHDRTGRPVVFAHSSSFSEWNVDKTWSSQEWKSDELMEDRTERHVANAQHTDRIIVDDDEMNSYTEAESELSLESRSFLHRVNDQVRKRQNQSSKDATKDSDKHSVMWGKFMSSTLQASVFMRKNYSDNWHSIKNTEDLTMKQMFDISDKLITEKSDEIYGISTISWENSSWKYLSLVMNKSSVSCTRSTYSQILYCALERWTRSHNQILHGKTDCLGRQVDVVQEFTRIQLWTELMASQWNSSGISSKDSPHCSSVTKSKSYCQDWV